MEEIINNPRIATNNKRIPTNKIRRHLFCLRWYLWVIIIFVAISGLPSITRAATLYFSPASGSYSVGQNFTVNLYVSSPDQAMNAASGVVSFPADKLEVVSLSKTGSIFNLWIQEPVFSSNTNSITFEGIVLNPGFIGSAGKIITINFKGKSAGDVSLVFSSGSVLANDGKGINILTGMTGGTYIIGTKITTPSAEETEREPEYIPPAPKGAPGLPKVFSSTHSDPEDWYSNSDPEFNWSLPAGITAVKLLVGKIPDALPTVVYSPPVSEKKLEGLADGIWYFHIQFLNSYGWGETLHRKIKIDTQPPEPFKVVVDMEKDLKNPAPVLYFDTSDSLSGVQYYQVKISEQEALQLAPAPKNNPYRIPPQSPGTHRIIVEAFDEANNSTSSATEIIIEALDKPIITEFSQQVKVGDPLTIKGESSCPDCKVKVFVKKEGEEAKSGEVKTDTGGNWIFINPETLTKGVYQIWAELSDERGAKSLPTDKITIIASLPPLFKIGELAISYLTIIITLLALIVVLVGFIFYTWLKISSWRKRAKKKVKEAEKGFTEAFKSLKEKLEKEVEKLDGKVGLSAEEKKIRDKLKKALEKSEQEISKEIKGIGRKIT